MEASGIGERGGEIGLVAGEDGGVRTRTVIGDSDVAFSGSGIGATAIDATSEIPAGVESGSEIHISLDVFRRAWITTSVFFYFLLFGSSTIFVFPLEISFLLPLARTSC